MPSRVNNYSKKRKKVADQTMLPAKRVRIQKDSIITYEIKDNELEDLSACYRWASSGKFSTALSVCVSTSVAYILFLAPYLETNAVADLPWNEPIHLILAISATAALIFYYTERGSKKKIQDIISKIKNRK